MSDTVLLLHGIWMRGWALARLARRLRAQGYAVEVFGYLSLAHGPDPSVARLRERMRALGPGPVHLVGHSLGGLIALRALADMDSPGRAVCLGSPLVGSRAAARLARAPGGRILLGRSAEILHEGLPPWTATREIGVIAGNKPYGVGHVLGGYGEPNDGTVAVAETRLAGIADHVVVPTTHTGLIFSARVAALTATFLRSGRFA